jgi:hypothetical protein
MTHLLLHKTPNLVSSEPGAAQHASNRVQISYQLIRNITSPDEKSIGVQSFVANAAANEILKIETKALLSG